MPAGKLLAAYAYEVAPHQKVAFTGGEIAANAQLQAALDSTFDRSKIATAPVVSFECDTTTPKRTHPIRDAALAVAFGTGPHDALTVGLAKRLADSMDNRSKPALLMVSVHDSGASGERRVLLWTFPQQEVFNLHLTARGKPKLDLLEAFNRESSLRKVALIDGPNTKTGMLSARVLDFQATATEKSVADLWIAGFLAARLQMNSAEGTKLLARVLRTAHTKTTDDQQAQDQLLAAITALRVAPNPRQSLDQIERTYLTGTAACGIPCRGRQSRGPRRSLPDRRRPVRSTDPVHTVPPRQRSGCVGAFCCIGPNRWSGQSHGGWHGASTPGRRPDRAGTGEEPCLTGRSGRRHMTSVGRSWRSYVTRC